MIQILILLAMIPLALAGLRLLFALVKGVFGFIFFGLILLLMVQLQLQMLQHGEPRVFSVRDRCEWTSDGWVINSADL